jgi:hypothetical protein
VATGADGSYSACGMRVGVVMLLVLAGVGLGCSAEKQRPVVGEDDITAAQLRNLHEEKSVLRNLEPTEEEARQLAEEELAQSDPPPGKESWAENHDLEEEPTTQDKVGQASIAILQVAVTIGAMVAPYFLF